MIAKYIIGIENIETSDLKMVIRFNLWKYAYLFGNASANG